MKTIYLYDSNVEISKRDTALIAKKDSKTIAQEPIRNVSSIILFGNARLTTQSIRLCLENHIIILYCRRSGKVEGYISSFHEEKCKKRIAQYKIYGNNDLRLKISKDIIFQKTQKQIQQMKSIRIKKLETKRNISKMSSLQEEIYTCNSIYELMGIEGQIASIYFKEYGKLINVKHFIRSKHPANDHINALLNLTYSLISSVIICALISEGLDAAIGLLHSIKNGRPSLALDILELYRADCDHFVSVLINQHQITEADFTDKEGYILKDKSFIKYIERYEENLRQHLNTRILESIHSIYRDIECNLEIR